jgi:hypothetical protein
MKKEKTATETRQGEPDRRIFTVLVLSTAFAAVLAIGAYIYVFNTDNEEIADEPVQIIGGEDEAEPG